MNLLPIVTILSIYVFYWKCNRRKFGIVSLLIMVYILMCVCSLILEFTGLFPPLYPYSFFAMIHFSLCFIVAFAGFAGFREYRFHEIRIDNKWLFPIFENFLMIGGLFACVYFIPFAWIALSGDIRAMRSSQQIQHEMLARWGIINSIFSILANCFILMLICAFLNLTPRKGKRHLLKAYLLYLASFSYVLYNLAYVGRDGTVFWVVSFVACFYFLKGFIILKDVKTVKRITAIFLPVVLAPLILISYARFAMHEEGVLLQMVNYGGQQIRVYNDHYQVNAPLQHGRAGFRVWVELLEVAGIDFGRDIEKKELFRYYSTIGLRANMFKTFIGGFVDDFGKLGALVALSIMAIITRISLQRMIQTGVFYFSNILFYLLSYQMVLWGVFYNRLSFLNYYMIFVLFLAFIFRLGRNPDYLIYQKQESNIKREV